MVVRLDYTFCSDRLLVHRSVRHIVKVVVKLGLYFSHRSSTGSPESLHRPRFGESGGASCHFLFVLLLSPTKGSAIRVDTAIRLGHAVFPRALRDIVSGCRIISEGERHTEDYHVGYALSQDDPQREAFDDRAFRPPNRAVHEAESAPISSDSLGFRMTHIVIPQMTRCCSYSASISTSAPCGETHGQGEPDEEQGRSPIHRARQALLQLARPVRGLCATASQRPLVIKRWSGGQV